MKQVMGRVFKFFLVCVLLLLGTLFMFGNFEDVRDYGRVDQWAETSGVLTILPGQSNTKVFAILYDYEVDGRVYTNDRVVFFSWITFGGNEPTAVANDWVSAHRLGDEVTVYYDPGYPERSVLYRDIDFGRATLSLTAWMIGACVLLSPAFLFVGYLLFLRGFLRRLFSG